MKFFFQIILVFFVIPNIAAQSRIDNLYEAFIKQTDLDRYAAMYPIMLDPVRSDSLKSAIKDLSNIAKKETDYIYIALLYSDIASYYHYLTTQTDSTNLFIEKGLEMVSKVEKNTEDLTPNRLIFDRTIILLNNLKIVALIREHKYALALKLEQDFLERTKDYKNPIYKKYIHYQFGLIHTAMGNGMEAINSYSKSLEYNPIDHSVSDFFATLYTYCGIADGYELQKSYDEVIAWCDTINNYHTKNKAIFSANKPINRLNISFWLNRYYAFSYMSKDDTHIAEIYLQKCDAAFPTLRKPQLSMYYQVKSYYYYKIKDYDLSYNFINKAIEEIDSATQYTKKINLYVLKSNILKEWGKPKEAYELLNAMYILSDSISQSDMKSQIATLESIYEIQNLETELKLHNARLNFFKTVLSAIIVVLILVLIIVIIIWRSNNNLRKKNQDLHKGHKKAEDVYKDNEELRFKMMLLQEESDPQEVIILKLDKYMKESQAYLNPDLTRDEVALEIATNRQYLIEAIREKKDLTFNEYLYFLRIQYAYALIVNDPTRPIAPIYAESGFTSQAYFNKSFKKQFGMTPSELRTAVREDIL